MVHKPALRINELIRYVIALGPALSYGKWEWFAERERYKGATVAGPCLTHHLLAPMQILISRMKISNDKNCICLVSMISFILVIL